MLSTPLYQLAIRPVRWILNPASALRSPTSMLDRASAIRPDQCRRVPPHTPNTSSRLGILASPTKDWKKRGPQPSVMS
ncbi:uncharacterized protein FOMMEDRAFT_132611 [Fomitiporia mediterranea MF3/22]|uniref:uncharacterized protein n=1 Tax=Fomitiporia mediterranea (strain MF3/22) TaxID=694068 RepID=UPI0004409098|nr:uncharacterized protein FOMMEDRAFT_132611 [Fomitiporia mediterranea MF3/22]EJD06279.1 hypothetical protein FOMMEDRAFT_132611 [Fomitiporia mediterranea MF3/22]